MFLYFLYITSEVKQYHETLILSYIYQCSGRWKHAWAFSETVQKFSKITYTASRFSLLTSAKFAVNINRVTLQHNKELIVFTFYLMIL